jgi:hypothetical protein
MLNGILLGKILLWGFLTGMEIVGTDGEEQATSEFTDHQF